MRFHEILREETTTLTDLYSHDFPDDHEMIWNFVGTMDFDTPLDIRLLPNYKLTIMLLSQYRVEHLDEIVDMLDSEQMEIVDHYKKDPNLSNSIIVVSDGTIVDGNHRALAAALTRKSIKCVDLTELSN